jgi:choline-glycine betaine transporter
VTFVVAALVMFALAAFAGSLAYDGYRSGKMVLISGAISPVFDRSEDSLFYWGALVFNVGITAIFAIGGVILLLPLVLPR